MTRPRLDHFIAGLSAVLASRRGSKSDLARFLGIRPHQLSEWLSGRNAPNAEYVLGIQEWLRSAECGMKTLRTPHSAAGSE